MATKPYLYKRYEYEECNDYHRRCAARYGVRK